MLNQCAEADHVSRLFPRLGVMNSFMNMRLTASLNHGLFWEMASSQSIAPIFRRRQCRWWTICMI